MWLAIHVIMSVPSGIGSNIQVSLAWGKILKRLEVFGPHMVLAETIHSYKKLSIQTRLNGEIMQDAKLSQLIFDIPTLISYISKAISWRAGDVLVTGTPGGVGFKKKTTRFYEGG